MASTLETLVVRLVADANELEKELREQEGKARSAGERIGNAFRLGARNLAAIGVAATGAATALTALASRSAEYANEVDKAAVRTNLARSTVQELMFVAEQSGGTWQTIEGNVRAFTGRLAELERGSESMVQTFKRLGVATHDSNGALRSQEDLLFDTLEALAGVENQTEQSVLAVQAFGETGLELVPILSQGADGLKELRDRANELGLVMDDQSVRSLVEYRDSLSEVQQQWGALQRELAVAVLPILKDGVNPALQGAVSLFRAMPEPIQGVVTGASALGVAFAGVRAAAGAMGIAMGPLFGPAGLVFLGVTAVAALAVALAGQGRDEASLKDAIDAVNVAANDTTALQNFDSIILTLADNLSGPVKTAFQGARDDIWAIVTAAESAQEALARISLGTNLAQEVQNDVALGGAISSVIDTRGAEFNQAGRLRQALFRGQFTEAATIIEELIASFEAIGDTQAVANLTAFLADVNRAESEVQKLVQNRNAPPAPPGNRPPPGLEGPAGTDSDPVAVTVKELPVPPQFATSDARSRATIDAVERTAGVFTSVSDGLQKLVSAGVVLTPDLVSTLESVIGSREDSRAAAAELARRGAPEVIGLPDPLDFSSMSSGQRLEAERLVNILDAAVEAYNDELEESVKRTTPRLLTSDHILGFVNTPAVQLPLNPFTGSDLNFDAVTSLGRHPNLTFDLETERFLRVASAMDLVTTNTDRAAAEEARLAREREAGQQKANAAREAEEARWRAVIGAQRFGGSAAQAYTDQLALQTEVVRLAAQEGISLTEALRRLTGSLTPDQAAFGEAAGDLSRQLGARTARGDGGLEEARRIIAERQAAADRFAETVVQAGASFTSGLIAAIEDGDIGAAFQSALGFGQSLLGSANLGSIPFLGGSLGIGTLLSAGLGIFGSIIGALTGGNNASEATKALDRGPVPPAINLNFTVNQSNTYNGAPTDPATEQAFARQAQIMFESIYRRFLEDRFNRLETRAGIA